MGGNLIVVRQEMGKGTEKDKVERFIGSNGGHDGTATGHYCL